MSRLLRIPIAVAAIAFFAAAQDSNKVTLEVIGKGFLFTQGPAWSKEGFLVFSDSVADVLWKWTPGTEAIRLREHANGPGGNAFDLQGRLYTCETHARHVTRTSFKDNHVEVLADQWEGKKLNAPANLVVSKSEHVYFTDPAFGEQSDHRELDFYGVYHISPKGPLKLVAKSAGRPNGIGLSPNGRVLYVTNTDEKNVRAYEVDRNGDTSNERVLIAGIVGVPAGVHVSDKGDLYIATPNGIAIYSPEGKAIRNIPMRDPPSNCVFDPDGKTLYVTARGSVYRIRPDPRMGN